MNGPPANAIRISDPSRLGETIRRRRLELGWTQAQLSALAGVGTRFLSELERGKTTAEIGKVLQLTSRMGLDFWLAPRSST